MEKSEIQHRPRNPLQHPQKLIIEIHQHWTDVFKNGFTTLSCPVVHTPQWTPAYFKVYTLGDRILSVASAINPTGTAI